jgi:lysyl-tRNA synthetase class 2
MPLDDQIAQRQANFQAIRDLGVPVYPNHFDATDSVSAVVARHGGDSGEALEASRPEVRVAGRIIGIRAFGKASFLVLSDGLQTIQAYLRTDSIPERDFAVYKRLDFGDHVGVAGRVFRSKTNELTIWASSLTFLAKCFLPLPEKWHGLQDIETRYRQRYRIWS